MDKRTFYSQLRIARSYDQLRFGGSSGARVSQRELALVGSLLPDLQLRVLSAESSVRTKTSTQDPGLSTQHSALSTHHSPLQPRGGLALDLACGTGRALGLLAGLGYRVVGLDGSAAMLARARAQADSPLARGDAFALPFSDSVFDAVVALRLAFHFADLQALLAEVARVLAPGGSLVFDTYRWSPRALLALGRQHWGERVYAHADHDVVRALGRLDLAASARQRCFLFSPYLYRRLPLRAVEALERLEPRAPAWALARTFWRATSVE
ncbi:MAG: class I SAM-dependent methyltransferase [Chloroflexi bacterium]|nr:class I SAM-dependent methyltransferase [Chloroflexota bacterium]